MGTSPNRHSGGATLFSMSIEKPIDRAIDTDGHRRSNSSLYLAVADVPDAPGRPLVTGFTSRSIDLSWAKPRKQSEEAPITGYSIVTG